MNHQMESNIDPKELTRRWLSQFIDQIVDFDNKFESTR